MKKILSGTDHYVNLNAWYWKIIQPMVSIEENEALDLPVHEEEIKVAVVSMEPRKSSGPDGFPSGFDKRCWNIVKNNVWSWRKTFSLK